MYTIPFIVDQLHSRLPIYELYIDGGKREDICKVITQAFGAPFSILIASRVSTSVLKFVFSLSSGSEVICEDIDGKPPKATK